VIWVRGELDADTARAVRARLAQAQRHARTDVVLDLTGVTFVDTVGLTSVVAGAKAMGEVGHLRVISPPDRVARLFEEAGMEEVFELTPDRRERHDRRKRDVPVEHDRRRGDRRASGRSGTGVDGDPSAKAENGPGNRVGNGV
jgi:anti-sigma B factor antagonist